MEVFYALRYIMDIFLPAAMLGAVRRIAGELYGISCQKENVFFATC